MIKITVRIKVFAIICHFVTKMWTVFVKWNKISVSVEVVGTKYWTNIDHWPNFSNFSYPHHGWSGEVRMSELKFGGITAGWLGALNCVFMASVWSVRLWWTLINLPYLRYNISSSDFTVNIRATYKWNEAMEIICLCTGNGDLILTFFLVIEPIKCKYVITCISTFILINYKHCSVR